ncbi:unnamed protein product, partial [Meganyctiphanes norvegica]
RVYFEVVFNGSQPAPEFIITGGGNEITQTLNSKAGILYGKHSFSGVDFEGTFYIGDSSDDDYAGFVFGYQSSKTFYVVMWKRADQNWWNGDNSLGLAGLQLKRVHSITGPTIELSDALWGTKNTTDQVTLLWHDSNQIAWEPFISYRWQLIHRPHIGLIRFRFLEGAIVIVDSGNIYEDGIVGGRLGAYYQSQEDVTFSNLEYSCNDYSVPQEVYDDLPADKQLNVTVDTSTLWVGKTKAFNKKKKTLVALYEPGF